MKMEKLIFRLGFLKKSVCFSNRHFIQQPVVETVCRQKPINGVTPFTSFRVGRRERASRWNFPERILWHKNWPYEM